MFKQILPTSAIRNIWRIVRRTYMLILGLKVLKVHQSPQSVTPSMNPGVSIKFEEGSWFE